MSTDVSKCAQVVFELMCKVAECIVSSKVELGGKGTVNSKVRRWAAEDGDGGVFARFVERSLCGLVLRGRSRGICRLVLEIEHKPRPTATGAGSSLHVHFHNSSVCTCKSWSSSEIP